MVTKVGNGGRNILTGTAGPDTLKGLGGNDLLSGAGGNDTLRGDNGADQLDGGSGDDRLYGGNGNDVLLPGTYGKDRLDGGIGNDTVSYANATTAVWIQWDATRGAAGDTFFSIENFIGSRFGDILTMQATGGSLFGGRGNDNLYDEMGGTVRGDDGDDYFSGVGGLVNRVWLQYDRGTDTVTNFTTGEDRFLLSAREFHLPKSLVGHTLPSNRLFINVDRFAPDPATRLVYDQHAYILWADLDGSGDRYHAVPIVDFSQFAGSFSYSDFYIIA